jgi:hypothetical protein
MHLRSWPALLPRVSPLFLVALLPLTLTLTACGSEPAPAAWVGSVSGSDVVVAMANEKGALRAYVCGGATTYASHSRWFQGSADSGSGAFEAARDGWSIAGETSAETASGTITAPGGEVLSFAATAASESALEGLFAVEDSGCETGVVAQTGADGEPWVQGTWCDNSGHFAQVTPVMPIELTKDGLRVRVDLSPLDLDDLYLYAAPVPAR